MQEGHVLKRRRASSCPISGLSSKWEGRDCRNILTISTHTFTVLSSFIRCLIGAPRWLRCSPLRRDWGRSYPWQRHVKTQHRIVLKSSRSMHHVKVDTLLAFQLLLQTDNLVTILCCLEEVEVFCCLLHKGSCVGNTLLQLRLTHLRNNWVGSI